MPIDPAGPPPESPKPDDAHPLHPGQFAPKNWQQVVGAIVTTALTILLSYLAGQCGQGPPVVPPPVFEKTVACPCCECAGICPNCCPK